LEVPAWSCAYMPEADVREIKRTFWRRSYRKEKRGTLKKGNHAIKRTSYVPKSATTPLTMGEEKDPSAVKRGGGSVEKRLAARSKKKARFSFWEGGKVEVCQDDARAGSL